MLRVGLLLLCAAALRADPVSDIAAGLRSISLDQQEAYRIRDLSLFREDVRIYLTDGYLLLATPVGGRRIAAVFTADAENGDAEILVMPPTRSERRSLAAYTGSPTLNEHFQAAVFVFSDQAGDELMQQIRETSARRVPEIAAAVGDTWNSVLRNITGSFSTRLMLDLLAGDPKHAGILTATVSGRKLGNFDVQYDRRGSEQIVVGKVVSRDNRAFFDVWTSFPSRSARAQNKPDFEPEFRVSDYRIEATVEPDLRMTAVTRVRVTAPETAQVLPFDISGRIRVKSASVDGSPAAVVEYDSLRSNLRNAGNSLFLVVPEKPLEAGRPHEIEFRHEGQVISEGANKVFFVGSRANWYPNRGFQFSSYDLTFRYPKDLDLVATGDLVDDKADDDWRVTRRRTPVPVRLAGFNLGVYEHERATRDGFTVDAYGNRSQVKPLPADPLPLPAPPTFGRPRRPGDIVVLPADRTPVPRVSRLQQLATDVTSALEFMAARFGPPALKNVTVSPVPGAFGQGFPGLIYLSTISYQQPEKQMLGLTARQQFFFTDVLLAHEVAHQWWGNVVTASDYHDGWLMEAMANYSALMYLEKRKGPRMLEAALDEYRKALLDKTESGPTIESIGPVVMGSRLETSIAPQAWRSIIYGKGSWILHMLRRYMGDERFHAMLARIRRDYEFKPITTEGFRRIAAGYLPPKSPDPKLESFFDQWVYATGIPAFKLNYSVKGKAPLWKLTATVTQSEVDEEFSALVPVEIQFARGKPVTQWVRASSEPVSVTWSFKQAPSRAVLDPAMSVLKR